MTPQQFENVTTHAPWSRSTSVLAAYRPPCGVYQYATFAGGPNFEVLFPDNFLSINFPNSIFGHLVAGGQSSVINISTGPSENDKPNSDLRPGWRTAK